MQRFEFPLQGIAAPGVRILCENQLEEVWHQVRRYGTPEYCDYQASDDSSASDLEAVREYVVTRVLQALELREAAHGATVLTRPLLVYYSLLNLVRAMITLSTRKTHEHHHGLSVRGQHSSLSELSARLAARGTLIELLKLHGISADPQTTRFYELLQSVPELSAALSVPGHASHVSVVRVSATSRHTVSLHFPQQQISGEEFEASWPQKYPSLVPSFVYSGDYTLKLKDGELPADEDLDIFCRRVGKFCDEHLEVNLIDPARWYIVSSENPHAHWPREARYLAALFMLAHAVRYQPELLYRESIANSYHHTLVDSVVRMADRYVPQMLLGWTGSNHFFGG